MKKLLYLLFVLLVGCLVSCDKEEPKEPEKPEESGHVVDYASINYYVWVNESDHTISLFMKTNRYPTNRDEAVLQPGESFTIEYLGFAVLAYPNDYCREVRVLFDEGPYEWTYGGNHNGYFDRPTNYAPRYDPRSEPWFEFEQLYFEAYPNCDAGRWTYTFTNADYDAVVSYWPWKEAQEQQAEQPGGER